MSDINSDLPIPTKNLQTPCYPQFSKWINGLEAGRLASNVTNVINSSQIKRSRAHS